MKDTKTTIICNYNILYKILKNLKPHELIKYLHLGDIFHKILHEIYGKIGYEWLVFLNNEYLQENNPIFQKINSSRDPKQMSCMFIPKDFMTQMYVSCINCKKTIPGFCLCLYCNKGWCPSCSVIIDNLNVIYSTEGTIYNTSVNELFIPVTNHACGSNIYSLSNRKHFYEIPFVLRNKNINHF